MPDIKNSSGRLTRYGLACGYIEHKEREASADLDRASVSLQDEHGALIVVYYEAQGHSGKLYDAENGTHRRRVHVCRKVTEARQVFDKYVKEMESK